MSRHRLALGAVLALAAGNFGWQLGSSSFYVDEILSLNVALSPLRDVISAVRTVEITPPAYFYFLHEWIYRTGSHSEWVVRLPSVLCGVALVAAVYWLALGFSARRGVALAAALLAALSPYVLEYAQRSQGYVFVMLASTVAYAAALAAGRGRRHQPAWLAVSALFAVLALWLHYTTALVIVPLCVWVGIRRDLRPSWRGAYVAVCAVAGLALIPVVLAQHRAFPHRSGVAATAKVTGANIVHLLQTPFDGRAPELRALGVVVTLAALLVVLIARRRVVREPWLLLGVAAGEPLALFVISLFGGKLMLTRYAAAAAPFELVAIACAGAALAGWSALGRAARPAAAALALGAAVVAVAGLQASHQDSGFYLDARGVARYLQARVRPADGVLAAPNPGSQVPLLYYGLGAVRPTWVGQPGATRLVSSRAHRLWIVSELPARTPSVSQLLTYERPGARTLGYRVIRARVFSGVVPMAVSLWAPLAG